MEWNNADSYESWKKLMSLKGQVSLKKELNAERVKKYSAKMAAGLTYNYAAKQVNDQILGVMQNLADEMELLVGKDFCSFPTYEDILYSVKY